MAGRGGYIWSVDWVTYLRGVYICEGLYMGVY